MGLLSFIKEAGEKLFSKGNAQAAMTQAQANPADAEKAKAANDAAGDAILAYINDQNLKATGLTVTFDSGGVNLKSITMVAGSAPPPTQPAPAPPPSGGTSIVVADWNIQINDDSASHAQAAIGSAIQVNPYEAVTHYWRLQR